MYAFNWALTAFRSESYIGSATALPDITVLGNIHWAEVDFLKPVYRKSPQISPPFLSSSSRFKRGVGLFAETCANTP